jgi:hypothetical protein
MEYGKQHTDGSRSGGQPPAPKLLTEAGWANLIGLSAYSKASATLRERGLITEEPVDPLLVEAGKICERHFEAQGATVSAIKYRQGGEYHRESDPEMSIALAALRRGIEIGEANRKELTREGVQRAFKSLDWYFSETCIDKLTAALQEQLK